MIHIVNIKSKITKELVDEIVAHPRHNSDFNFEVFTKHKDKLYNIFINKSIKILQIRKS